jgi:hypothetical protein
VRTVGLLALLAVVAGCGGKGKPLGATARPCLAKLGTYIHHKPVQRIGIDRTPSLPVLDPDQGPLQQGQRTRQLPWPDDFQEYGEVSFPAGKAGANAVQVLIFGGADLPQRVLTFQRKAVATQAFCANGEMVRVGQSLVIWSSTPTGRQNRALRSCLAA